MFDFFKNIFMGYSSTRKQPKDFDGNKAVDLYEGLEYKYPNKLFFKILKPSYYGLQGGKWHYGIADYRDFYINEHEPKDKAGFCVADTEECFRRIGNKVDFGLRRYYIPTGALIIDEVELDGVSLANLDFVNVSRQ